MTVEQRLRSMRKTLLDIFLWHDYAQDESAVLFPLEKPALT